MTRHISIILVLLLFTVATATPLQRIYDAHFLTTASTFIPTLRPLTRSSLFGGLFGTTSDTQPEASAEVEPQDETDTDSDDTEQQPPAVDDKRTEEDMKEIDATPSVVSTPEGKTDSVPTPSITIPGEGNTAESSPISSPAQIFGSSSGSENKPKSGNVFGKSSSGDDSKGFKLGGFSTVGIIAGVAAAACILGIVGALVVVIRRRRRGFEGMRRTGPDEYRPGENSRSNSAFEIGEDDA